MSYSEITFNDKNPVKRWLQRQRLVAALKAVKCQSPAPSGICDFGAGNGELCKHLVEHYPSADIICYEPAVDLFLEAKENLDGVAGIRFYQDINNLKTETLDLVFALEVFEHLPSKETRDALSNIHGLLKTGGKLVVGVPVEVGIPALYKGGFRMMRRYGAFDASAGNILFSFAGRPPANRPVDEIAPGFNYYFEHVGFDYRKFKSKLESCFNQPEIITSPFSFPGTWLMPEVYFTVEKN